MVGCVAIVADQLGWKKSSAHSKPTMDRVKWWKGYFKKFPDTTYVEEAGCLEKILLIIFMNRMSWHPQCGKVVGFSSLMILSLVFADDVILLASLCDALIVQWFAAQCEIDVMGSLRS